MVKLNDVGNFFRVHTPSLIYPRFFAIIHLERGRERKRREREKEGERGRQRKEEERGRRREGERCL